MANQQDQGGFKDRLKAIGMAFSFTFKRDKLFLPLAMAAIVVPFAVVVAIIALTQSSWFWLITAFFVSLLALLIVLNIRTTKAVTNEAVGRPGAAYAIVDTMRGWHVTPGVAVSTQQDLVHRAVGKPGVVLLAEGSSGRLRNLVNQEKKKLSRVVGSTPIYDFNVGEDEGQVPLAKLRRTLTKLPPNISATQAADLQRRLVALRSAAPIPKGPVPTNAKMPKGARKAMRGR